jgi:hypothetical protein
MNFDTQKSFKYSYQELDSIEWGLARLANYFFDTAKVKEDRTYFIDKAMEIIKLNTKIFKHKLSLK